MTVGGAPRVVSLLPAGTEIVAALGALETLVGITHECDYPAEVTRLPRVTTSVIERDAGSAAIDAQVRALSSSGAAVFALDAAQLALLAPTLILTQSLCDICAVSDGIVHSLADVVSPAPSIVTLAGRTLDGVFADIVAVGRSLGRDEAAHALMKSLDSRMRSVHDTLNAARAPRPRVAVIEWLDPLFAAGHWTPDVVRRSGGIDVLAVAGAHSTRISAEQVQALDPELIVFAPCGFDLERAAREARILLATAAWSWVWTPGRQLWALDGNALTSRPGPRLVDAVEAVAGMIAPTLCPVPAARYASRLTN